MNYISSKFVRNIFLGMLLFVVIGLTYTNILGKKQDQMLKEDYIQYEQAIQSIQNNQIDSGINALEKLVIKYPNEPTLHYQLGLAYSVATNFEKASLNYQKALDRRPALLQDQQFTFKMGEALYHIGQLEKSRTYLSMPVPEKFKAQKDILLLEINNHLES